MLVQTIIADLLWEMEFLQGRWAAASRDWQSVKHGSMHARLQGELQRLRSRVRQVEGIARSLAIADGEAVGLSLLQATCRTALRQGNAQNHSLKSLA